jgi:Glycosyl hydrolases family 16/Carbohydrate binding domain
MANGADAGRSRWRGVLRGVVGLGVVLGLGCGPGGSPEPRRHPTDEPVGLTDDALATNLLANGSFETDLQGWTTWQGTLSRVALSGAPDGSYVVKVAPAAGTSGSYSIDDLSAAVPSPAALGTYTASASIAAANASSVGKPMKVALRRFNTDGTTRVWETNVTLTQTFQKVTVTGTIDQSGQSMDFYVYQGSAVSTDAFYADALSVTPPGSDTPPPGWRLVFQDDFSGTAVDTTQWSMYNSPGHAGNGLRRPEAFSVANGLLAVTAQMVNGTLVSGGMAHKGNYKYGRFEFRVRTEADPSGATSGVVLTWPQSEQWPVDGENDIYETGTGTTRSSFSTFIHYGADNRQHYFRHAVDATQWHIVAMEWEANALRIYRDGVLVWTLTDLNAIPDVAHHLCIQLDAFKASMGSPVKMYVDWVKIYQR